MLQTRRRALERIVDAAQNVALSHREGDRAFPYYNAKEMIDPSVSTTTSEPGLAADADTPAETSKFAAIKVPPKELVLHPDRHFYNQRVNLNHSSVHVPTNVFDRGGFRSLFRLKVSAWYFSLISLKLSFVSF